MDTLILFCFLFVSAVKSTACDPPVDINTATKYELTSLPYITPVTAQLIIDARDLPFCSPLELTGTRKIKGITANRLNKDWNWFENQECSDTCCLAEAACESQFRTIQLDKTATRYYFKAGDYNTCTSECGIGTQNRDVQCSDSNDNIVDDIYCATLEDKLVKKRVCKNNPCPTYEWVADNYGECVADSQGICSRTRVIKCYDTANNELVDDSKCEAQDVNKPDDTIECNYCTEGRSSLRRSLLDTQTTRIGDDISVTVDLLNELNSARCKTDMYRDIDDKTLVTRRACTTNIGISVDGISGEMDASWFYLQCTLQAEINENFNDIDYSYTSKDSTSGSIIIDIPSDGYIGEFICNLYFQNNGKTVNRGKVADFTLYVLFNPYDSSDAVYMDSLINRREYVENEWGLIWVGSSNDNTARSWIYDQFYFPNLKVSMTTLKRLSLQYRNDLVIISRQITYSVGMDLCYGKWGDGPYTTGKPWGGYQCNALQRNCREPWSWTGTTQMFDVYRNDLDSEYRVQYCQCWVYAGMSTTIGRALGIPTRPTSNFQSAHDTDFNRALESYWILNRDENTLSSGSGSSQDSVWNFHVWHENYFKRTDFVSEIHNVQGSGWQAVDSTPQEKSYGGNPALAENIGAYQMGPAAIALIQDNKNPHECYSAADGKARFGCFDTEFVISETNANYNLWLKSSRWQRTYTLYDSFTVDPWDEEYGTIGALTNTKKPGITVDDCLNEGIGDCDDEYVDLTFVYKQNEPSDPGLPTNLTYHFEKGDQRTRRRSLLWSDNDFTNGDFDFEGLEYNIITIPNKHEYKSDMIIVDDRNDIIDRYGSDYTYGMIEININSFHNNIFNIYCQLSVTAHDYSGKQLFGGGIIKHKIVNIKLNPGESTDECKLDLYDDDYLPWIINPQRILSDAEIPYIFRFTATATIFDEINENELYDIIIEQRDVLVCAPLFKLNDRIICRHSLKWFEPMNNGMGDYPMCEGDNGISDGFCDEINNFDGCFDGGDCCKQTCKPNKLYKCPYFNCIDERIINKNENYKKCPKIQSFINYIHELIESGVCNYNQIVDNFICTQNGNGNGNECIDQILIIKDKFGDFESCYKEAFNAFRKIIQPIVKIIADCIILNKQTINSAALKSPEPHALIDNTNSVTAIATFTRINSGVYGTVIIDENGNINLDLDVSELDVSICENYNNNIIEIGYAIYDKWDYGNNDKLDKYGNKCEIDMIGNVYNPFNMPKCENNNYDYFECEIGDLSSRLGVVKNDNNKIVIEGNVSENNNEKEGGFCKSSLKPQILYQRSIVFYCNNNKENILFCAPFQINKNNQISKCKQEGEECEVRNDCCDSECVDLEGNGKKICWLE